MIIATILSIAGLSVAAYEYNIAKNRAIKIRRDSQYGYTAVYNTKAAQSLDLVIFEIKKMNCYAIKSYIYETLSALHGVKEVQMKSRRKDVAVVFDPNETSVTILREILERKMHFDVNEINYNANKLCRYRTLFVP